MLSGYLIVSYQIESFNTTLNVAVLILQILVKPKIVRWCYSVLLTEVMMEKDTV